MSASPTSKLKARGDALSLGVVLLPFVLAACAPAAHGNATLGGTRNASSTRVERRELDRHPPINLVVRLGDPLSAVAFASTHDSGPIASVALSALILARLRAHEITEVVSVPTQTGLELAALCTNATAARAFIDQVTAALSTPLAEHDDALPAIQEALAALRGRTFSGHAEAAVADCSGEIGLPLGATVPDATSALGRAALDKYRQFAFTTRASAFAALGSSDFVNAAASELGKAAGWPRGDAAEDAWPAADSANVDAAEGRRHLSVALRLADADRALSSLAALSPLDSDLELRLHTFLPEFRVGRVAFLARPRGACLRVDLELPEGDPGPTANQAVQATSIVSEELRVAFSSSAPEHALDENIIQPSDPREAAARAARRALTGRLEPGPERRIVALAVHPAERAAFDNLDAALSDFETRPARAPLETRIRSEPGQGELWLLVGSPCGTLGESNEDAGQSAVALTLAAHGATAGVTLEPWLTADAVGLLAHAARKPNESDVRQGERVARALARALSERDASGNALGTAQAELFGAIGGQPRPGYARLLDALAPDHSAWLEPRGTWATLSQANRDSVGARGRDLLRGPLRMAVLANRDDAQASAAAHAFERWLAPWRDDPRRCQTSPNHDAHGTEITLAVPGDSSNESAYVGVPFRSRLKYDREAEAIAELLNAPDGTLALALSASHISGSAHASIVGGASAAALIVEIHASDDDAKRATLEARRVLERLSQGSLSAADLAAAERLAERRSVAASLDPRRRIVDLWRGAPPAAPVSPVSLRAFQASLSPAAEVVVTVTHKD